MTYVYIAISIVILFFLVFIFSACKVAGDADKHLEDMELKECQTKKIQQ